MNQEELNQQRAIINEGVDNVPTQNYIINRMMKEREEQDNKFGSSPRNMHSSIWVLVLLEELGEVARAILEKDSEFSYI